MNLFTAITEPHSFTDFCPGIRVYHRYWTEEQQQTILNDIHKIAKAAPFFRPKTFSGQEFHLDLTNCGELGWIADEHGYRYEKLHPITSKPWPKMPSLIYHESLALASAIGHQDFSPQSCLINRYPKYDGRLGSHQDKTERNHTAPIITFSFGDDCRFAVGGYKREDSLRHVRLCDGDVCVMFGPGRMLFHGVEKIHPMTGNLKQGGRISLTVRQVY
ncbi:MAG: alpha-ketoglutarate-dependent dioxygenase AlkB [Acidobacteria bacterium]|nr:alpha-ketoglutarate-dependent dioxygenase AlkB [Acidobacteriota bacterium]